MVSFTTRIKEWGPGLLLLLLLTAVCIGLSALSGVPVMLYALLAGMVCGKMGRRFMPVLQFSSRQVLRAGVALLGAKIGAQELWQLGWAPLALVLALVAGTLVLGLLLSPLFRQRKELGLLCSGATAICGASAALAISSTLPDRDQRLEEHTLAVVAAVNIYSTIAMLLYPLLARSLGMDNLHAGLFLGSTIHDVAQVVGAGLLMNENVAEIATIVKLLRVALLSLVVFVLTLSYRRVGHSRRTQPLLPTYLLIFFLLIVGNSVGIIPSSWSPPLGKLSKWLLVWAVVALGMKTHISALRKSGSAVFGLVLLATIFIGIGGLSTTLWLF